MPAFAWDPRKSQSNLRKHGVSFELVAEVFTSHYALSRLHDRFAYEEKLWVTIGQVRGVVVLVVAHTIREEEEHDVIRIISARRATRRARQAYKQRR